MSRTTTGRLSAVLMWVAGIGFLVLLVAFLGGAFAERIPASAEPVAREAGALNGAAEVHTVTASADRVQESFAGSVRPVRETVISSRIIATIREVLVHAEDRVAAGDGLVLLDDRELQARVAQAREALNEAQTLLADATRHVEDIRALRASNHVSPRELEQAETAYATAVAGMDSARERARETEIALSYANLQAPIDGIVVDRYAEPGDTASPGVPLLRLYDPSAMRLEAYVRESLAIGLVRGQQVRVRLEALDREVQGTVEEIIPQAEVGSRSFLVKIGLPAGDGLYPGMFGRLLLSAETRTRVLIPEPALIRVGQLDFVIMADELRSRRMVVAGRPLGDGRIEILSGLAAGERIYVPSAR